MRSFIPCDLKMAPKKRTSTSDEDENESNDTEKYFTWTDEEPSLLLQVTTAYKTDKTTEGKAWESIKSRYEDIMNLFCERYPKATTDTDPKQFPNTTDTAKIFTKDRIIAKIKRIKISFRKAVDSGRRSGGGRVVTILYDECAQLWEGSPSVEAMENGLDSSAEDVLASGVVGTSSTDGEYVSDSESNVSIYEGIEKTTNARRDLMTKVKEKRNSKLTKKVSTENRMLALGQQDIELKMMIDYMKKSDKQHTESMESFATSLQSLNTTLQSGFNLLGAVVQQSYQPYNMQRQYSLQPNNVPNVRSFDSQFEQR